MLALALYAGAFRNIPTHFAPYLIALGFAVDTALRLALGKPQVISQAREKKKGATTSVSRIFWLVALCILSVATAIATITGSLVTFIVLLAGCGVLFFIISSLTFGNRNAQGHIEPPLRLQDIGINLVWAFICIVCIAGLVTLLTS